MYLVKIDPLLIHFFFACKQANRKIFEAKILLGYFSQNPHEVRCTSLTDKELEIYFTMTNLLKQNSDQPNFFLLLAVI